MTVTLPTNAPVTAKNKFRGTDARGLQAASTIENKQGSIAFADGRGAHTLGNSFGSIEATDNRGDLTISNTNGSINVRKIDDTLTAIGAAKSAAMSYSISPSASLRYGQNSYLPTGMCARE